MRTPALPLRDPHPQPHAQPLDLPLKSAVARFANGISPASLAIANADWLAHLAVSPSKQAELASSALRRWLAWMQYGLQAWPGEPPPATGEDDRRFSRPEWQALPFNVWAQGFLFAQQWWVEATTGVRGVSQHHQDVVAFTARQWLDMLSPSNFPWLNPQVLRQTAGTGGGNLAQVNAALWTVAPGAGSPITPTPVLGERYVSVLKNLTGGERPLFRLGLQFGGSFPAAYGTFGGDGTIDGILNRPGADTTRITYTIDNDPAATAALNAAVQKIAADPEANKLRNDGLRWVPKVNGQFSVPVVAIHTLGDLFVPFHMMQIYRQRADASGNGGRLVTRAIRGISHCDFTVAEQVEAFDAMIRWEAGGPRPGGDDVLNAAAVASPGFGCTFSRPPVQGVDSPTTTALRGLVAQAGGSCPAP